MKLEGKVAIITGSTRGAGQAEALLFAREGAKVIVNSRHADACEEAVSAIRAEGGEADCFAADVGKAEGVKDLVDYAVKTFGRLDILVNNAGVSLRGQGDGSVTEIPEETWDFVQDVNLKGTYLCCKYAIPPMIAAGGGSIVNTSSIIALRAGILAGYSSAKAGVIALTKSIALAYVKNNIRANVLCPGSIDTPMIRAISNTPEAMKERLARIPMGRLAQPMDIARAALFLASDDSAYITGAVLPVDGGLSLKL